jgi:hypothetical protein
LLGLLSRSRLHSEIVDLNQFIQGRQGWMALGAGLQLMEKCGLPIKVLEKEEKGRNEPFYVLSGHPHSSPPIKFCCTQIAGQSTRLAKAGELRSNYLHDGLKRIQVLLEDAGFPFPLFLE